MLKLHSFYTKPDPRYELYEPKQCQHVELCPGVATLAVDATCVLSSSSLPRALLWGETSASYLIRIECMNECQYLIRIECKSNNCLLIPNRACAAASSMHPLLQLTLTRPLRTVRMSRCPCALRVRGWQTQIHRCVCCSFCCGGCCCCSCCVAVHISCTTCAWQLASVRHGATMARS